jgi:hypothetical protein
MSAFEEVYKLDRNVPSKLSFGDSRTPKGKDIYRTARLDREKPVFAGYRDSVRDYSYLWTLAVGAL